MKVRGDYSRRPDRLEAHQVRYPGRVAVLPLRDGNGGLASAEYEPVFNADGAITHWRFARIASEMMPPAPPQERAVRFTDRAWLPPLRADGGINYALWAEIREAAWVEHEKMQ